MYSNKAKIKAISSNIHQLQFIKLYQTRKIFTRCSDFLRIIFKKGFILGQIPNITDGGHRPLRVWIQPIRDILQLMWGMLDVFHVCLQDCNPQMMVNLKCISFVITETQFPIQTQVAIMLPSSVRGGEE